MECDLERKKEGGPEWRDPEGARENKKKKSACQGKEKVFKKYEGGKKRESWKQILCCYWGRVRAEVIKCVIS